MRLKAHICVAYLLYEPCSLSYNSTVYSLRYSNAARIWYQQLNIPFLPFTSSLPPPPLLSSFSSSHPFPFFRSKTHYIRLGSLGSAVSSPRGVSGGGYAWIVFRNVHEQREACAAWHQWYPNKHRISTCNSMYDTAGCMPCVWPTAGVLLLAQYIRLCRNRRGKHSVRCHGRQRRQRRHDRHRCTY